MSRYKNNNYYQWCIELKEISQAIGSIGVVSSLKNIHSVDIGYCISKKYWNKGIMTEALNAVIDFLFNSVNVNRIQTVHAFENKASGRVMEKCGMKYEGTNRQAARNCQSICDICVYAIIKE